MSDMKCKALERSKRCTDLKLTQNLLSTFLAVAVAGLWNRDEGPQALLGICGYDFDHQPQEDSSHGLVGMFNA